MMVPEKVGRFDSKLFVQGNSIALIIAKPHADYIRIINKLVIIQKEVIL
jgi:hypothetical protein